MANKEYSMLFKLSAQVGREFNSSFSSALQQMNALQREINDMQRAQADISAYTKQQQAVEKTAARLEDLKRQHDNIQQELAETGDSSSDLKNKLIDKERAIADTTRKLEDQTRALDEMEEELREAGYDTDNLGEESEKLGQKMDALAEENKKLAEESQNYGISGAEAFDAVGSALIAAGIAEGLKKIGEAYKECVELSAGFEATMSTVEALSGATKDELASLSEEAKRLGATTEWTASQVAEGMTYMGMAGWSAEQMLAGMDGVIKLASASGEDLAMVADIVTDNLTAFGMQANDTAHFSDVLAAAATNSNTSVSVMGETFKKAAPVAGALKYSVEDVAIAVGLMANAGVKGSRAGTALSNTFTGLLDGVTLTGAAIGEVTVSAQNSDGTMKSFRGTIEALREQFAQMTEAEKTANAMAIAGKQGYAGLLAILNATDADYAKLTASINNCTGAAERMAAIKLDNYKGQVTLLNSAMDALKTTVGDQFRPELTKIFKLGTDVISGVTSFMQKHPVLLKSLMALTAEAGALLGVYTAYTTVKKVKNALDKASLAMRALETAATVKQTAAEGAETAATVGATAAQNALNASMLANPVLWLVAGVAALTVGIIALTNAEKDEDDQARELTRTSREQYEEMKNVRAEYDEAVRTYGENSEEAEYLRWRVDELTDSYESNRQTMDEYIAAHDELIDSLDQSNDAILANFNAVQTDETRTLALVHRLEELASQTEQTVGSQEEMKAIISALNAELPELALNYDDIVSGQKDFAGTVETYVKAAAAAKRYEAAQSGIVEAYNNRCTAEEELALHQKELELARDRLTAAEEAHLEKWGDAEGLWPAIQEMFSAEQDELTKAQTAYDDLAQAIEKDNEQLAKANEAYQACYNELEEFSVSTDGATEAERNMNAVLQSTQEKLDALTTSYTDAYTAALESVQGQYSLWQKADEVVAVSASDINAALESQAKYWSDYHANLDKLQQQTGKVEGLSEVIASFADGSNESVAAIAGMANASTEDLQKMVANYKKVQEEQGNVSDSLADLATDFTNQMAQLQSDLERDVAAMDLSAEAAANGKATVDAFASAAENAHDRVANAFASLRSAAVKALSGSVTVSAATPGGGRQTVTIPVSAYAIGTRDAARGLAIVGERGPELVLVKGAETKEITSKEASKEIANATKDLRETRMLQTEREKQYTLVGKNGPEIVRFEGGERVYTAQETAQIIRETKELNAYAVGTKDAERGLAIVGERGSEIVAIRGGVAELKSDSVSEISREISDLQTSTNQIENRIVFAGDQGPELLELHGGERVFSAKETSELVSELVKDPKIIHSYAAGTRDAAPGLALIGERGPEIVAVNGNDAAVSESEIREIRTVGAAGGYAVNVDAAGSGGAVYTGSDLRVIRETETARITKEISSAEREARESMRGVEQIARYERSVSEQMRERVSESAQLAESERAYRETHDQRDRREMRSFSEMTALYDQQTHTDVMREAERASLVTERLIENSRLLTEQERALVEKSFTKDFSSATSESAVREISASSEIRAEQPITEGSALSYSAPVTVNLTIQVDGGASGQAAEQIRAAGDELKDRIIAIMEEYAEDRARRVYA